MTTMTIHAEDEFAVALKNHAARIGKSINQTVKDVFIPILGLADGEKSAEPPWMRFYGASSKIDEKQWKRHISESRTIDSEMWK